jgi:hypothetical protein
VIYNIKMILDFIKDGVPVRTAEQYALDFVAERALELGKEEEWEDRCGRREKMAPSPCLCDGV